MRTLNVNVVDQVDQIDQIDHVWLMDVVDETSEMRVCASSANFFMLIKPYSSLLSD